MEFLDFLIKNWMLVIVFVGSGALLFLWPQIQNRFSPAAGVSTLEATKLINAGGTIVLDVRDAPAYAEGHLGRAINIPLAELRGKLHELRKKSPKNILVYCDRGQKSLSSAKILAELNTPIHNLQGGLMAWKEAGLPVEKNAEKNTEKNEERAAEKTAAKKAGKTQGKPSEKANGKSKK
ncbi:MAG: rhodanese-like domain-containing protein [Proteobacteria bacterium]|nr:rhodanese-like domain-containing protein [Pseudomonadota bacterium]MCL2307277.1 rhodanese-like domain-containing protein [Pseudomonadota bacterium]